MSKTASGNLANLAASLEPIYGPEGWATKLRQEEDRRVFALLRKIRDGEITHVGWANQPEWPHCEACGSWHAVGNPTCVAEQGG